MYCRYSDVLMNEKVDKIAIYIYFLLGLQSIKVWYTYYKKDIKKKW